MHVESIFTYSSIVLLIVRAKVGVRRKTAGLGYKVYRFVVVVVALVVVVLLLLLLSLFSRCLTVPITLLMC